MSKFKVGDKVRIIGSRLDALSEWVGLEGEVLPKPSTSDWYASQTYLRPEGKRPWGRGPFWWTDKHLELVEEPRPFKSGDRVRVLKGFAKGQYGKVVTSYSSNGVSVILDGTCGESLYYPVDSVQYAPDQTFVLDRGDRIVNKITGRRGHVVEGQDEELWVVDESYSEETGAKAAAVEEYEQHYPNTYEITKKGPF